MDDDLVAAFAFGLKECAIRAGDNGGKVFLRSSLDQADANGELWQSSNRSGCFEPVLERVKDLTSPFSCAAWHGQHKLLTAVTAHEIVDPHRFPEHLREQSQGAVSGLVTVFVLECFEVIKVG